jgi:O-antigen/teichoic acid export membrane protein
MIGAVLTIVILFIGIMLLVGNLVAPFISDFLFGNVNYTQFVRLILVWVSFSSLCEIYVAYLRARNRITLSSFRRIFVALATMIAVLVLSALHSSLNLVLFAAVVVQAVALVVIIGQTIREDGIPKPNFSYAGLLLAFSLPQIANSLLLWIVRLSDRYFITSFLGLTETGVYSSSIVLASVITLFYAPVNFVLYPLASKLWDNAEYSRVKKYLEASTKLFLLLSIPACAGLALLSQPLLKLLTTTGFLAGSLVVLLISVGNLCLGLFQLHVNIIYLEKRTKLLPAIISMAAFTTIILNFILVPIVGLLGSAIANIVSFSILAAVMIGYSSKRVKYRLDSILVIKSVFATVIMSVFLWLFRSDGIVNLVLSVLIGSMIYAVVLYFLKVFSDNDLRLLFAQAIGGKRK